MLRHGVILTLTALGSDLGAIEFQVNPSLAPSTAAATRTHARSALCSRLRKTAVSCRSTWRARLDAMTALQAENSTVLAYTPYSGQHTAGSPGFGESSDSQFSAIAQRLSGPPRSVHSARVNRHGMGLRLNLGTNGSTVAHDPEPPEYWLLDNQLRAGVNVSEIETCSSQSWLQRNSMHGSDSEILQPNVLDSYVDDQSPVSGAARLLLTVPA